MNRAYWLNVAREESRKARAILADGEIDDAAREALADLVDDLARFAEAIQSR